MRLSRAAAAVSDGRQRGCLLKVRPMELKTARLTILIDPEKKLALEKVCAEQDVTPSQVVRRLIRDYIAQHAASGQRGAVRRSGKAS